MVTEFPLAGKNYPKEMENHNYSQRTVKYSVLETLNSSFGCSSVSATPSTKLGSAIKQHYWTSEGFNILLKVTQPGKGFLAHRLESGLSGRGAAILIIMPYRCSFIRLCTVRRDGRDGLKGGAGT